MCAIEDQNKGLLSIKGELSMKLTRRLSGDITITFEDTSGKNDD